MQIYVPLCTPKLFIHINQNNDAFFDETEHETEHEKKIVIFIPNKALAIQKLSDWLCFDTKCICGKIVLEIKEALEKCLCHHHHQNIGENE